MTAAMSCNPNTKHQHASNSITLKARGGHVFVLGSDAYSDYKKHIQEQGFDDVSTETGAVNTSSSSKANLPRPLPSSIALLNQRLSRHHLTSATSSLPTIPFPPQSPSIPNHNTKQNKTPGNITFCVGHADKLSQINI